MYFILPAIGNLLVKGELNNGTVSSRKCYKKIG